MSKVVPFRGRSVSPKMKVKKGGFLEELRTLLVPAGVNPTITALGLTAASRGLSRAKRRKSPAKKRGRKQKGGDLLSELIAPQGLSATGTAALLLGANALARKPARKSPAKKTAKKAPAKKTAKKSPAKKTAKKSPAKKTAKKSPAKKTAKKAARKPARKSPAKKRKSPNKARR